MISWVMLILVTTILVVQAADPYNLKERCLSAKSVCFGIKKKELQLEDACFDSSPTAPHECTTMILVEEINEKKIIWTIYTTPVGGLVTDMFICFKLQTDPEDDDNYYDFCLTKEPPTGGRRRPGFYNKGYFRFSSPQPNRLDSHVVAELQSNHSMPKSNLDKDKVFFELFESYDHKYGHGENRETLNILKTAKAGFIFSDDFEKDNAGGGIKVEDPTDPNKKPKQENSAGRKSRVGMIVGITMGVLLILGIVGVVAFILIRNKRKRAQAARMVSNIDILSFATVKTIDSNMGRMPSRNNINNAK